MNLTKASWLAQANGSTVTFLTFALWLLASSTNSFVMLSDSHEKSRAWKRIWFLSQTDENDEFCFYKHLSIDERNEFIADYYDFLDYKPGQDASTSLRNSKTDVDLNEDDPRGLFDPANYSFGEKRCWIPWAKDAISGNKRGRYSKGYPKGLVVHWTAGHRNGLEAGNRLMRNTGMLYLLIDDEGKIAQSDSLEFYGYHAGKSNHNGAAGYVSDEYAGVEVQAAGMLTKDKNGFYPWWDKNQRNPRNRISDYEVTFSPQKENITAGYYHRFTDCQVWALRRLVAWLYLNNPEVFKLENVVGHDEISPRRKVDPGGSIVVQGYSLTMSEFRDLCRSDISEILKRHGK